jgi:hypothetical protein
MRNQEKVCPLPEWVKRTQDFTIFLRLACNSVAIGGVSEVVAQVPPYTSNNLSTARAAAYAEQCRTVVLEERMIPLRDLRKATRRYAGRASKYFRNDGQAKLNIRERLKLWRWRQLASRMATPETCVDRLQKIANIFDRDRHHLII